MRRLVRAAGLASLVTLMAMLAAMVVLARDWQLQPPLAIAGALLASIAALALRRRRAHLFSASAGAATAIACASLATLSDHGFVAPWAALGAGMAAALVGARTCQLERLLPSGGGGEADQEAAVFSAVLGGYLRTLGLMGIVMASSLLVLLLSLNLRLGSLPVWLMVALALAAILGLHMLASAREDQAG